MRFRLAYARAVGRARGIVSTCAIGCAALGLAGCSAGQAVADRSPCTYLTVAEARALLHANVSRPARRRTDACLYAATPTGAGIAPAFGVAPQIVVTISSIEPPGLTASDNFTVVKRVRGIGDRADWITIDPHLRPPPAAGPKQPKVTTPTIRVGPPPTINTIPGTALNLNDGALVVRVQNSTFTFSVDTFGRALPVAEAAARRVLAHL
jgi:hypothetical protein